MSSDGTRATCDATAIEVAGIRYPHAVAARSLAKRSVDVAITLCALIFLAPLMLVLAAAIRLDSPGPALFRQRRTGLGGKPFTILKFRTMQVRPEEAAVTQASIGDKRLTRIGGFLRELSLDELPQLINVLTGDMSLIGPRPHALSHDVAWAKIAPRYNDRFRVRPGLSGLAQVSGLRGEVRSDDCVRRRIEADNTYVETWSLMLDAKIIVRTFGRIFRDPQAY